MRSVQDVRLTVVQSSMFNVKRWSDEIAVGSMAFVENVKNHLGVKAAHRDVIEADGSYAPCESAVPWLPRLGDWRALQWASYCGNN